MLGGAGGLNIIDFGFAKSRAVGDTVTERADGSWFYTGVEGGTPEYNPIELELKRVGRYKVRPARECLVWLHSSFCHSEFGEGTVLLLPSLHISNFSKCLVM